MTPTATLLRVLGGITLWAVHFAAAYGYTALACARGLGPTIPFVVGVITVIGCAAGGIVVASAVFRQNGFPTGLACGVGTFAVMAMAVEGLSAMLLIPCR